jgi:hypothetical protein
MYNTSNNIIRTQATGTVTSVTPPPAHLWINTTWREPGWEIVYRGLRETDEGGSRNGGSLSLKRLRAEGLGEGSFTGYLYPLNMTLGGYQTRSERHWEDKNPLPPSGLEPRIVQPIVPSKGKGKAVPLQAWSGPESSRKLRFPDYMTTAQDGGKVVSLKYRPPLPPGNAPVTHFC